MADISCAFCVKVRPTPPEGYNYPAATIMKGFAVCLDHAYYLQDEVFNRALAIIKADENKLHPACTEQSVKSRSISASVRRRAKGK